MQSVHSEASVIKQEAANINLCSWIFVFIAAILNNLVLRCQHARWWMFLIPIYSILNLEEQLFLVAVGLCVLIASVTVWFSLFRSREKRESGWQRFKVAMKLNSSNSPSRLGRWIMISFRRANQMIWLNTSDKNKVKLLLCELLFSQVQHIQMAQMNEQAEERYRQKTQQFLR